MSQLHPADNDIIMSPVDDGYETEEEIYAIMDLKDLENMQNVLENVRDWQLTCIDAEDDDSEDAPPMKPLLKLGSNMIFQGELEEMVGTALCFEEEPQQQQQQDATAAAAAPK